MIVFKNDNPTQIYLDALQMLLKDGDDSASPRGKKILELRPVSIEFQVPRNRVTYLKGRVINPFFQLAEALWILSGRSDVKWLEFYNKNISSFSDNGVYFNAPYGERIRSWGKNDANGFIFNPIDQLRDNYFRILEDPDTRQAVITIGDPRFDDYSYTNVEGGKDIACNLNIKFKLRKGELHMTVDNRSNDLHWGVFGANLCQFATIQEVLATWLGVNVGSYHQVTDSLHVYVDSYGAGESDKIMKHYTTQDLYEVGSSIPVAHTPASNAPKHFTFSTDPIMSFSFDEFSGFMVQYWNMLDHVIHDDKTYADELTFNKMLNFIDGVPDQYWRMTLLAMAAFNSYKRDHKGVTRALGLMPDSQWKVSCLRYLSKKYADNSNFLLLYKHLEPDVKAYIERTGE